MNARASTPPLRIRDATLSGRVSAGLSDLVQYRHLVWYMAMTSLAVDSRGTKLGRSWWIIEPIALMGVYTLFVRVLIHRGGPDFPLVVLAAILAFEFFARSVARSMSMVKTVQTSMLNVSFPRSVIPLGVTLSETIRFFISIGVYLLIAAPFGFLPTTGVFLALPFIFFEILFTLGAAYFFAATGVFFRDLSLITAYLFWLAFHLAPGMYTLHMVPPSWRKVFYMNPLTTYFEGLRAALMHGRWPAHIPYTLAGCVFGCSVLLCVAGYVYFLHREGSFNKVVL
ncbi:MAG TPA: ABC transporter permease [Gaiellaceae bacterium]